MAQNDKVRDLLLKDVEEEIPIYTCFSSYEFDSFIRSSHVYQDIWTTVQGETYGCTREPGNEQDCNAVAKKNFLCVRFMEDDYDSSVHAGLEKSVRFIECPL